MLQVFFYLEEAARNNNIIILEMEKQIFKVGDKVYDFEFGWGVVADISRGGFYNTKVNFETKAKTIYFTRDGRYEHGDEIPRLSFTEYNLIDGGLTQKRLIDYNEYIGKWGKFWNGSSKVVIDTLAEIKDGKYGRVVFNPRVTSIYCDNFEPLTEEQLKILNLE